MKALFDLYFSNPADDFTQIDTWKSGGIEKPLTNRYRIAHSSDQEPVNIIKPNWQTGPWIAGGAVLRWYQNQPVGESDIDIFCSSAQQADAVIQAIKSYGRYTTKFESENAITLSYTSHDGNQNWVLQVIKRRFFNSPKDIIDNFDISVCKLATDGHTLELGENTAKDVREKNLRFQMPLQPDALKRLTKYWTYGYRPVEGTIESIQNNPVAKWHFNSDEDYHNAF